MQRNPRGLQNWIQRSDRRKRGAGRTAQYLRKMAVDGYIIHLDMDSVKELNCLLRSISGNINQIARRCNETRSLYAEDVEDLRKGCAAAQAGPTRLLKK